MADVLIQYIGNKKQGKRDNVVRKGYRWNYRGDVQAVASEHAAQFLSFSRTFRDVTGFVGRDGKAPPPDAPLGTADTSGTGDDPEIFIRAVVDAIDTLDDGDFTGEGKPKADALSAAVGEPVSAKTRDDAWDRYVALAGQPSLGGEGKKDGGGEPPEIE
jgi:hypothetical protein